MAHLVNIIHSSNGFHKQPGNKLVAEASTLSEGSRKPLFGRVYDDSCDEGFSIRSERTGRIATYHVNNTLKDAEGDVTGWELTATRQTQKELPCTKGMTVIVFND